MIQATYNGVKKFFETLETENKKAAQDTASVKPAESMQENITQPAEIETQPATAEKEQQPPKTISTEPAPKTKKEKLNTDGNPAGIIKTLDDSAIREFTNKFKQALQEYKKATAKYIESFQSDSTLDWDEILDLRNKVNNLKKNMRTVIGELMDAKKVITMIWKIKSTV